MGLSFIKASVKRRTFVKSKILQNQGSQGTKKVFISTLNNDVDTEVSAYTPPVLVCAKLGLWCEVSLEMISALKVAGLEIQASFCQGS